MPAEEEGKAGWPTLTGLQENLPEAALPEMN
jgi:hypothetical protein